MPYEFTPPASTLSFLRRAAARPYASALWLDKSPAELIVEGPGFRILLDHAVIDRHGVKLPLQP